MSDTLNARITELMALNKIELAQMIAESEAAATAPVSADAGLAAAVAPVDNTSVSNP